MKCAHLNLVSMCLDLKKKKLLSKFVQLPLKGLNESELPQIHFVLHLVWTQCYKTDVTKCCSPAAPEKPE